MKNTTRISSLTIVCVLCAAAGMSSVHAAPSVRSLGGAGIYTSASNASAARASSALNSARAGSIRKTTGTATGLDGGAGDSVRAASSTANPRLSIGSYLNSGKTISGGGSIVSQNPGSSGGGMGSGDLDGLQGQIDSMQTTIDALQDSDANQYNITETNELLDEKQDALTAGTGIDITDGVISSTASMDIPDASVAKTKLTTDVQTSLGKADSALQGASAPSDGSDYVLIMNGGAQNWFKVAY